MPETRNNLGAALWRRGDYAEAERELREASGCARLRRGPLQPRPLAIRTGDVARRRPAVPAGGGRPARIGVAQPTAAGCSPPPPTPRPVARATPWTIAGRAARSPGGGDAQALDVLAVALAAADASTRLSSAARRGPRPGQPPLMDAIAARLALVRTRRGLRRPPLAVLASEQSPAGYASSQPRPLVRRSWPLALRRPPPITRCRPVHADSRLLRRRRAAQRAHEEQFREVPDAARLKEYMEAMSAEPHVAGRPVRRWSPTTRWRSSSRSASTPAIEESRGLMPWPPSAGSRWSQPTGRAMLIQEPPVPEDPDSRDADQLPTYNAYSIDGDVTGDARLRELRHARGLRASSSSCGIDVKGKIVIARYGGAGAASSRRWRPSTARSAASSTRIRATTATSQGDVYPKGAVSSARSGAQRGSVMDMPIYPGDPLTPGVGRRRTGAKRLAVAGREDAHSRSRCCRSRTATRSRCCGSSTGPVAPEDWRGALPITYHVGPGPAQVHLKLAFDWTEPPALQRHRPHRRAPSCPTSGSSAATITTRGSTARTIRSAAWSR